VVVVRVFDDAAVRASLHVAQLAEAMRAAFMAISDGSASVPPRMAAYAPAGLLGAMPGYVPGLGLGAKLVTYFRDNEASGVPGHQAVIVMFDPSDGRPVALLDATYITAVRTAVAAAVAAKALANADVQTVAVIGTGVQARSHLAAFAHLFGDASMTVAGRSGQRVRSLADATGAVAAADIESAVRAAEIVCLCTDADDPVIDRSWLRPGCHVSSVGSGREIDAATLAAARVFVESRANAVQPFPAGSRELEGRNPDELTEVGEVLLGTRPGREAPDEVTVYKSMGHGAEDIAAASVVLRALGEHAH
jgi:alanine dehydrogenase